MDNGHVHNVVPVSVDIYLLTHLIKVFNDIRMHKRLKMPQKQFRKWWPCATALRQITVLGSNWSSAPIYQRQTRKLRLHGRMIKATTLSSVSSSCSFSKDLFSRLSSLIAVFLPFSAFNHLPLSSWIKQERKSECCISEEPSEQKIMMLPLQLLILFTA